jgi:hypothetical protein
MEGNKINNWKIENLILDFFIKIGDINQIGDL